MHIVKRRYKKNTPTLLGEMSAKADKLHKIRKISEKSGGNSWKTDVRKMHIIRIYAKLTA